MPQFHSHDEEERQSLQDPDAILADIGVGAGLVVVDIRCGEGFFTIPSARRVGKSGIVFGIDINHEAVGRMCLRMPAG